LPVRHHPQSSGEAWRDSHESLPLESRIT